MRRNIFMHFRPLFLTFLLATFAFVLSNCSARLTPSMAANRQNCPITKPSDRPFVPPAPYPSSPGSREFLYGSPALWAIVYPDWHVHSGGKLPFFRQGYESNEGRPRLAVVARRLDGEGPLVWNGLAGGGINHGRPFMVTGIDIPSSGCWEIAAQYVDNPGNIGTLTYTVWVEP
jgi:hypothetical protein